MHNPQPNKNLGSKMGY